jgi:hypothetical protein
MSVMEREVADTSDSSGVVSIPTIRLAPTTAALNRSSSATVSIMPMRRASVSSAALNRASASVIRRRFGRRLGRSPTCVVLHNDQRPAISASLGVQAESFALGADELA